MVKDDLWWKTTFGGRRPSVEDNLRWKVTFSERRPSVEDDLQWQTTFVGSLHAAYSVRVCKILLKMYFTGKLITGSEKIEPFDVLNVENISYYQLEHSNCYLFYVFKVWDPFISPRKKYSDYSVYGYILF